ncbi:MAG: hypothetical protein WC880_04565 [Candidatus Paceibacterota bacterium]
MGQSFGSGESRRDKIAGSNALLAARNANFKRTGPKSPTRRDFEETAQKYWPEEHRPA